jgi:hypothetical protein
MKPVITSALVGIGLLAGLSALDACSTQIAPVPGVPDWVVKAENTATSTQGKLQIACSILTSPAVAGFTDGMAPYILAACTGDAILGKLLLDPTSLEWLNGMIAKVTK